VTFTATSIYAINSFTSGVAGTAAIAAGPLTGGLYEFSWDDNVYGSTIEVGDVVNGNVATGGGQWTLIGIVDATGEPIFQQGGGVRLFTSGDPYDPGDPIPYNVTSSVACFLPGTQIATPDGEVAVEALQIGDLVVTADGRAVSVRWIGIQTVVSRFGTSETRFPVVIAAGAFGEGLPARELRVTADHALLVDGVLVNAGALVNGTTIRRITPEEIGERFTVYHIETDAHEVILAEGMPTETFVGHVSRRIFDNHAQYAALYGDEPPPLAERTEPRAMSQRQVPPHVRTRVAECAATLRGENGAAA
jgi:hypothetical protein